MKYYSTPKLWLLLISCVLCRYGFGQLLAESTRQGKIHETIRAAELEPALNVQRFMQHGQAAEALEYADLVLATNAANKYIRIERAQLYGALGDTAKEEADLDYLITNSPEFGAAYPAKARVLLAKPFPKEGEHPLFEWLRSDARLKAMAALEVIILGKPDLGKDSRDFGNLSPTDDALWNLDRHPLLLGLHSPDKVKRSEAASVLREAIRSIQQKKNLKTSTTDN